jgi:hypothetical protein
MSDPTSRFEMIRRPSGTSPKSDVGSLEFFCCYVETRLPSRFLVALSTSTTKANPSKGGDAKLPVYRSFGRINDSGVTESDANRPVAYSRGVPSVSVISLSSVKLRSARASAFVWDVERLIRANPSKGGDAKSPV